jgi:hypothetical protein
MALSNHNTAARTFLTAFLTLHNEDSTLTNKQVILHSKGLTDNKSLTIRPYHTILNYISSLTQAITRVQFPI